MKFASVIKNVKRELRKIKSNSFRDYCKNLNFQVGIFNIWERVKAMMKKARTNTGRTYAVLSL